MKGNQRMIYGDGTWLEARWRILAEELAKNILESWSKRPEVGRIFMFQ